MTTLNTAEKLDQPYSFDVKSAAVHFGIAEKTIRNWIWQGKLALVRDYLKAGKKVLIKREAMIKRLEEMSNGRL